VLAESPLDPCKEAPEEESLELAEAGVNDELEPAFFKRAQELKAKAKNAAGR
jgi:hypothetical protein